MLKMEAKMPKATNPMTVGHVLNVVNSQLNLFGNVPLVTRPELDFVESGVELYINKALFLCCMSDEEMKEDGLTLGYIGAELQRLHSQNPDAVLKVSGQMKPDFKLGILSDAGFIELINYEELMQGELECA